MSAPSIDDADATARVSYAALQAVVRLTAAMSRARSSAEIYALALDGVCAALHAERGALLVFDAGGVARVEATVGLSASYRDVDDGAAPWPRAAIDPRPVQIADVAVDPAVADRRARLTAEGIAALAYVPLVGASGLLGHLLLGHARPRVLGEDELGVAQTVATQVAFTIERNRADQALRDSEARLREAQAIAQIGSFFWDTRTHQVTWSDELYRIYGRDRATFAPTFHSYVESMHPIDRPRVVETLKAALTDPAPFAHDYRVTLPDGRLRWMQARVRAVLGPGGDVIGLGGTCQDITERRAAADAIRASEERFQQLVETIHEGVWMTDATMTTVLYVSPVFARIFGVAQAGFGSSSDAIWRFIHAEDQPRVRAAFEARRVDEPFDQIYRVIRPDGAVRWIHARGFPVRDDDGVVHRVAGVVEDVTERRELEAQLRQSHKMEALGTLSGGIAHDFNNILGAIIGNTELAQQDLPPGHPALTSLAEIEQACDRARALVRQILMFSRRQPSATQPVALAPVVHEAVTFMRATLPAAIELVREIDLAAPRVRADPAQLHEVLVNLATNAWQAVGGAGRIAIALRGPAMLTGDELAGLPAGPLVCLSVSDTGPGMEPATIERIFEPFFTTRAAGEGSGLGLAVVHGIVLAHGGAIRVTSQPGRGTTFRVYLPAVDAPAEPAAPPPRVTGPGRGERILHVDDEVALSRLVARTLARLGYRITSHTSAESALDAFRAAPDAFDLILTDLSMPGLSGLDLAARALALRPDMPIVLISGHATEQATADAHRLGIRRVLHKPVATAVLAECLAHLFG